MIRLLAFGGLAIAFLAQNAQAQDAFAADARYDLTGESATVLRDQALAQAPGDAVSGLFRRLALPGDADRLPQVTPEEAGRMATGVEILSERASGTTYIATIRVFFDARAVRERLGAAGVKFAETVSKPVLVLPVFRGADGAPTFWDQSNPWLRAWGRFRPPPGLVPLAAPLGDLEDVADIGGDPNILDDAGRLARIAQRYGAGDIVIAEVGLKTSDEGQPIIETIAERRGDFPAPKLIRRAFTGQSFDALDGVLLQVVERVWRAVETDWKNRNVIRYGYENVLPARAAFNTLRDWAEIRRRLEAADIVRGVTLSQLDRSGARMSIAYQGELPQLETALALRDLTLEPAGDLWLVSLAAPIDVAPGAGGDALGGETPPGLAETMRGPDRSLEGSAAPLETRTIR